MEEEQVTKFPIAETFDSIQGEGSWVGTRMYFIRIAGCPVGKRIPESDIYEECTTILGQKFMCDTNFKTSSVETIDEIISKIPDSIRHVSITGGEPLARRKIGQLVEGILDAGIDMVHIETSGVTPSPEWILSEKSLRTDIWISCSPKQGAISSIIQRADELKLLVNEEFRFWLVNLPKEILDHNNVYLQPINPIDKVSGKNLDIAIDIIKRFRPDWKLSIQAHKVAGIR